MHRRLVHLCIVGATTLAMGRHMSILGHRDEMNTTVLNTTKSTSNGTCRFTSNTAVKPLCTNLSEICFEVDTHVTRENLMIPVLIWLSVFTIAHMPTLLLSSSSKLHQLKAGVVQLTYALLCSVAASLLFDWYPTGAYCLLLHCIVFLLMHPARTILVIGNKVDCLIRLLGVLLLILYAWHMGPAVPVLFTPELSFCCGAFWHFVGIVLMDMTCAAALFLLYSVFM